MSCVLRIGGSDFDLDAFFQSSSLIPCAVFRKGKPRSSDPKLSRKVHETSGANIDVSSKEFDDLAGQITDAIHFLKKNQSEIERLRQFAGVEGVTLDFALERDDGFVRSYELPAELLRLAGRLDISIELSVYAGEST